jgi:hypothetical protein
MKKNPNRFTALDGAVAAEVRADIARDPDATVKGIAEKLFMRRATLSSRVNGHAAFAPSLLAAVADELGTTASAIVARAEARLAEEADVEETKAVAA